MGSDPGLYDLADRVGHKLRAAERRIATAESCTGGWVAKVLTDIPGSSQWFECGFVTYSNASKTDLVGVPAELIASEGAISEAVARAMAEGALRHAPADLAVSVTGLAGPGGGSVDKPVGLVWFGCLRRGRAAITLRRVFRGDRTEVRRASVAQALELLRQAI